MNSDIRAALKLVDKTDSLIDSILREVGVIPEPVRGKSNWWTKCDFDEEGVDVQVKSWCGDSEYKEFCVYISVDDLVSPVAIEKAIMKRVNYLKKQKEDEDKRQKALAKARRKQEYEALKKEFE